MGNVLTTDDIRTGYVGVDPNDVDNVTSADFEAAADFDRWLDEHDARIRNASRYVFFLDDEYRAFAKAMFFELEKYGFFDYRVEDKEQAFAFTFESEDAGQYGFEALEAGVRAVNALRENERQS